MRGREMTSHSRRSAALFPLIPPVHLPVSCRCTKHAPPLHGCALPPPPPHLHMSKCTMYASGVTRRMSAALR